MDAFAQVMGGMGASPDGLGATLRMANDPPRRLAHVSDTRYFMQPLEGSLPIEPIDTSPGAAVQSAGIAAVLVALGFGVGLAASGPLGAVGGVLLMGGLSNGYRAQKWINSQNASEKHEAIVSGVFALAEVLAGGYAIYRAVSKGRR